MKAPILSFIIFLFLLTSCKDSESSKSNNTLETFSEEEIRSESTPDTKEKSNSNSEEIYEESSDAIDTNNSNSTPEEKTAPTSSNSNLSGKFIKVGEITDNSCSCYCVTINYTSNSEWCLVPSKIAITTRMEKTGDKTNVFLVSPSAKNTEGKDIPWASFDTTTPIASIISKPNGEMELDWLGFSINGDLAIDYAILGKKALEGIYKKK